MWENLTPVVCSLISDFRPLTPAFLLYAPCPMTAKRNDLMTAQPYDAKLDES